MNTPITAEDANQEDRVLAISIQDHFDCLPERARRQHGKYHLHPHWSATTSDAAVVAACDPPHWSMSRVSAIEPYYHITHRRKQSTFGFLSRKNGFTQTGESTWELHRAKELEIDPLVIDYQLGGLQIEFVTPQGKRHYTPDTVVSTATGHVVAEEVKASPTYFHEPEYRLLMTQVESGLASIGISFRKLDADEMRQNRRRCYNVAKAFDDRFAAFGPLQLDAVQNALAKDGGGASVGQLTEAMRLHPATALQAINAMMCKRHVSYDLNLPVGRETKVSFPPNLPKALPDIRAIQS